MFRSPVTDFTAAQQTHRRPGAGMAEAAGPDGGTASDGTSHMRPSLRGRPIMTRMASNAVLLLAAVAAGAAEPSPAREALDQAQAAHALRVEAAREAAAWAGERQRLEALIAATVAETQRLEREVEAAEQTRRAAEARLAALGDGADLEILRQRLADGGAALAAALSELSRRLPPGAVAPSASGGGEAAFDAAVRALEAAERAAGTVAVEVVTGERAGQPEAVKVLRVGGAAAWWLALDGRSAGVLRWGGARPELVPATEPAVLAAIAAAIAQVEGRQTPAIVLLPGGAP